MNRCFSLAVTSQKIDVIHRTNTPCRFLQFVLLLQRCYLELRLRLEALLTDTLVSGQLYLRPPSQNPVFLNSETNSVFLHSRMRSAPVTSTVFTSRGRCPLTRASSIHQRGNILNENKINPFQCHVYLAIIE